MTAKPDDKGKTVETEDAAANMVPGDEAPPGTPATGEDICPTCNGSGRVDGKTCETCEGRGRIIRGVSGGP